MIYDPLAMFTTLIVFLTHALKEREKEGKPQPRHSFWLSKRGRFVMRRLGIFLMRTGGKLVYLGCSQDLLLEQPYESLKR